MPCDLRLGMATLATTPVSLFRSTSLEIVVLYTTITETLAALKSASALAQGLSARIRLLVAQVVPYPLPLETPEVSLAFTRNKFRTIASHAQIDTSVDLLLGRDRQKMIENALPPRSLVVIGGKRSWWPASDRRLARSLERRGHHIVYATA